ncbi:MAG: twin-arginine translocase subunit TatC, partial [Solobacterium sp.]|nr:twin-arginine translocase subunit TatC [Solobacterium sp.]
MTTTKTIQTNKDEQGVMTLPGHLRELRNRIGVCLVVFIVGFFVALAFSKQLVQLLTDMGTRYHYEFVYIAPQELMLVHFSVAMLAAFIADIPVIVHQIYAFSSPAIENKKTKKVVLLVMLFGLLFFVIGVLFAYYISVPFMLYFLKEFGAGSD